MDKERILTLLERIGCVKIRARGDEIGCSCPFSNNHRRGDKRPSFGTRINSVGSSPYNCFSCGAKGAMEGLAIQSGNVDLVPDYIPKKVNSSDWHYKKSLTSIYYNPAKKEKHVLFKDDYLAEFNGVYTGYVKNRGILIDTARQWELGFDMVNNRAIFVVRDYEGRLAVVIGRDISGKSSAKYSNYVLDNKNHKMVPFIDHSREEDFISPTKRFFLYGEHKVYGRVDNDLVVVEGPMDVLMMWQYGYFSVGVLGSSPSEYQIDKMVDMVPRGGRLVVMADGDEAGERLTNSIVKNINGRVPVYNAYLPAGKDPASSTLEEINISINDSRICLTS